MSLRYILKRALQRDKLSKIFIERLTEPLHLNVMSLPVMLFGSYRRKVQWDLVIRQQYAFPILWAADYAKKMGLSRITVVEFGVAAGAGLFNMCEVAAATTRATGVEFRIVGFDSAEGLPTALDYRDLPESFQQGDYPMLVSPDELRSRLPANAELIVGKIEETVAEFLKQVDPDCPIGFVSVDVDYYSSSKACLELLRGKPEQYLPMTPVYLDDLEPVANNPWTGEMLAVNEFNAENEMRKIAPFTLLRGRRIFKNAGWIDRMFMAHMHDHPVRQPNTVARPAAVLQNEHI